MKYAIILPDGAADEPLKELDGQTPLAAARIPNFDWIASNGRVGTVRTVPAGLPPGSDVATLSVLGYSPKDCYTGRAPIEAAARGIDLGPDDVVFRCNLVTIADGRMEDFSAGHIRSEEGCQLIQDLNRHLGSDRVQFFCGVSYRNLMVWRGAGDPDVASTPPHDIHGRAVADYLPTGRDREMIRDLMARSQAVLAEHEVNQVRRDLGENPATSIWLWGEGKMPRLAKFVDRYGVRGALVGAVDLVRGIGVLVGWKIIDVAGATGYLDTNYAGKGQAAVAALDEYDMVVVHVEAPDEAGHNGDIGAKVTALEQMDAHIVGPVLEKLRTFADWKVLVAPDHPTPIARRTHTMDPPPFAIAGSEVSASNAAGFNERAAGASALRIDPGHELMEYFIKS
jgi:2,3-bisphosphoglycerate-independent phosphoglycerate mutase